MDELITEKELVRFSQADADALDHIFERNMNEYEINWEAAEIGNLPVLAHYYVKGEDMHYYVLARVHDEEDDLLTLFPVRMFNGAVLDEKTQEHAFAEEKLFGNVCLKDVWKC